MKVNYFSYQLGCHNDMTPPRAILVYFCSLCHSVFLLDCLIISIYLEIGLEKKIPPAFLASFWNLLSLSFNLFCDILNDYHVRTEWNVLNITIHLKICGDFSFFFVFLSCHCTGQLGKLLEIVSHPTDKPATLHLISNLAIEMIY